MHRYAAAWWRWLSTSSLAAAAVVKERRPGEDGWEEEWRYGGKDGELKRGGVEGASE